MAIEGDASRCSRCKQNKPRAAFAKNTSMRDGLRACCRECAAACHQQRQPAEGCNVRPRVTVPEGHEYCRASDGLATLCKVCKAVKGRRHHLKRSYGLTGAERDARVVAQRGLRAICLDAPAVHVDHCHKTGRVRGVLCFNCNSAIGKLGDDPEAARRAAAYLEGNLWKPTLVAQGVCQLPS